MADYFYDVDDVDVIFAATERVAPPLGFREQVLTAIAAEARVQRRIGLAALSVSLLATVIVSFLAGIQLGGSGFFSVLEFLDDLSLLADAPSDIAAALGELVPWSDTALALIGLGLAATAARLALTPPARFSLSGTER